MTDQSFAIHITWTTYGTWLPGDSRGYVSNTRLPRGGFVPKQNTPGTPLNAEDPFTRDRAAEAQLYPTVWLTREQATCVATALIAAASGKMRDWYILRAAVMTNHAHVVIANCPDDGPAVRRVLKGVTQAALSKQLGHPRQ